MCARPVKPRKCKCPYEGRAFKPTRIPMWDLEKIPLGRDELETLRLCDLVGLTQEQAGGEMGVSRGTVQRLLTSAHAKVARALTENCALVLGDVDSTKDE
jgi:uncharacterized protein